VNAVTRRLRRTLTLAALAAALLAVLPAPVSAADHGPCLVGSGGGERCTIWYGRVVQVDDGDTLRVKVGSRTLRVRITGIQAMELTNYNQRRRAGQCHAVEAADRLEQLVTQARGQVRLAAMDHRSTSRGRPLRSVAVKRGNRWVDVGRTLLREGLVLWMPSRHEWAWNPRYAIYVEQAQAARVGLWNTSACGAGPSEGAPLKLWVNWKSDSSQPGNPDNEWVRIRNLDAENPLPIGGWWLRDSGLREFRFPPHAVIPAGGLVTVVVGEGFDDDTTFHWGQTNPVFDNVRREIQSGDGAYLFDPDGDMRAWMTYPCRTSCGDPNMNAFELVVQPRGRDEWIGVRNVSPVPVGLEGYRLTARGHTYAFDSDAVLQPGEMLRIYAQRDPEHDTRLVKGWGHEWSILRDRNGAARLSTFTDSVLACVSWGNGRC